MAEEPSTKHHHYEPSDKSSNLIDVHVPGEKRKYTKTLREVELHGKETLEIVCTSEPDKADEMAAVLQLCVDDLCLVYHIAAATKWPKRLNELLQHKKLFTFAGFSIESDKEKQKLSGLEINPNKFIDIQRKWRVP
ncbi:hypothetical protein VPH35_002580 [Triticum aestivum]